MTRFTLEAPSLARIDSYRELVREFLVRGEPLVPFVLAFPLDDPPKLIAQLHACSRGEGLPGGFVAHTTYWLVRDDRDVVGVANLRHALTESLAREGGHIGYGVRPSARRQGVATELLRQTLARAAALGIDKALLTCAKANTGSVRTILANGGVLDGEEYLPTRREIVQRYWVATNARETEGFEIGRGDPAGR